MLLKKFYKQATAGTGPSTKDYQLNVIPSIDTYRKQISLVISPDKKQIIHRRIKIQGIANDNARTRQLKDELYLDYNYNPFQADNLNKPSHIKYNKQFENENFTKTKNIIDKFQQQVKDNERSKNALKEVREKIAQTKRDYEKQSERINKSMMRQKQLVTHTAKDEEEKENLKMELKITQEEELSELDIQRLISFKQQNAYSWRNRKVNIFKLIRDDNSELTPFEQLMKQNFSFTAMCQKPRGIKIPIFRDLSDMGRRILSNSYLGAQRVFDHILSYQLIFHMSELNYENIMNVVTNRFSPAYVERQINGEDEASKRKGDPNDSQSEESLDNTEVFLQKIQICKETNYGAIDTEARQIQDFKKVKYSSDEQNLAETCQTQIAKVLSELRIHNQLVAYGIRDKKLNLSKTQNVERAVRRFNKLGVDEKNKDMDMDAVVRLNRWNKDRKQLIKVKKFGEFLKQKNQLNRANKLLMRDTLIKNKENIHIEQ